MTVASKEVVPARRGGLCVCCCCCCCCSGECTRLVGGGEEFCASFAGSGLSSEDREKDMVTSHV